MQKRFFVAVSTYLKAYIVVDFLSIEQKNKKE